MQTEAKKKYIISQMDLQMKQVFTCFGCSVLTLNFPDFSFMIDSFFLVTAS